MLRQKDKYVIKAEVCVITFILQPEQTRETTKGHHYHHG